MQMARCASNPIGRRSAGNRLLVVSSSPVYKMPSLSSLRKAQASVDLTGKLAVVVGATSGIGEAVALRLAQAKARVLVVGRSAERGNQVVEACKQAGGAQDCAFVACDASVLSNVKRTCDTLASMAQDKPIDFLVLSQGIAQVKGRTETSDGMEIKLALHYYSRFAFAQCLAPLLQKSSDPRVLSVLSAGVHSPYKQYKEDTDLVKNFSIKNAADAAGFYNDLAVDFMSEMYPSIKFIHACPGFVATRWGMEMPWALRCMVRVLQTVAKPAADCAECMCYGLFSQDLKAKHFYLMQQDGGEAKPTALHAEAKEFMKQHTLKIFAEYLK